MAKSLELKELHSFMNDIWQYTKRHIEEKEYSETYWRTVVREGDELAKKYNNDEMAAQIIIAVMGEFERRYKAKNKED